MDLDFLILGAQKSATTWLTYSIGNHQDIFLPKEEIPCFEGAYYSIKKMNNLAKIFPNASDDKLKGIKNTHLLFKEESPMLIYENIPNVKFIVSLRDPVDRAVSAYFWHMRVGAIPVEPLNKGMLKILNSDRDRILEPGFYYKQLSRYMKIFGREQFSILLYEDIKTKPKECLRSIFNFLGVKAEFSPKNTNKKPKEAIYSLSLDFVQFIVGQAA